MGDLKDIVCELSGRADYRRRNIIKSHLRSLGLDYSTQRFFLKLNANLFVDFPGQKDRKKILIASHYDKAIGSPGANDNASAVAVVLAIAKELKERRLVLPVRLAFFDREEPLPKLGALGGSIHYVEKSGVQDIGAVFNMELVGEGSIPVYWSLSRQTPQYIDSIAAATEKAGKHPYFVDDIVMTAADHTAFDYGGVDNSICLTLACQEDEALVKEAAMLHADTITEAEKLSFNQRAFCKSKTFRNYHQKTDLPQYINEESLVLAKDIILNLLGSLDSETLK